MRSYLFAGLAYAALSQAVSADTDSLAKLKLQPNITLSGLSSGAYMAGQYHLAFAGQVDGVAMLAAGPVYCAQNSLGLALEHCFNKATSSPDMVAINSYLKDQQNKGNLAAVSKLQQDKVWIFHGSKDATVYPGLAVALQQQYQQWLAAENIALINDKAFGHTFPTDRTDLGNCDLSESPYLASCDYDAAGELLTFLLGKLNRKSQQVSGKLYTLAQHQLSSAAQTTLAKTGYLYVPTSCAEGQSCRLHVSFHGCKQNAETVGDAYTTGTGLNNYADSNNIVVLYPQTTASSINPFNPNACWDWWGYTSADYATVKGTQLQAVYQLVKAVQSF
ncbi:MAG: PHB depolymerase family esterase [Gammaproteobacteria bacterium]|nr:PHB depolymerase family esterase [Gammaproteobacteria bacterium]MBU1556614.1 PHB depolymerase family esterase [Gammaproteobacteria bacterium]MBU2070296.1 PHB depolymerase family esterase [Gammaproteobacteria bacterium]MBU2185334.1 PHB depolymerase family esterase [Gammaproteobacteria bacterium]MBU2203572.1 PHB depolymerase family esterase [Gammaproteobacteria bacterium]